MCCNTFIKIYVGMGIVNQNANYKYLKHRLTLQASIIPNSETHSNNLSTTAADLFECV